MARDRASRGPASASPAARALDAIAAACLAIAAYHVACALVPPLDPTSSPARHAAFVAINVGLAAGFRARPPWFRWVFAGVVLQQLMSHGTLLVTSARAGAVDVPSLFVVVAAPAALALLVWASRAAGGGRSTL